MNVFVIKKWLQKNNASLLVMVVIMTSTLYQTDTMGNLERGLEEVKTDVHELKTDVNALKTDVSQLKSDVNALKTDVSQLKSDVKDNARNINILTGKVDILIKNDYQNHRPAPTALVP